MVGSVRPRRRHRAGAQDAVTAPQTVPDGELADAIDAAEECPGECIFFDEA